jgi:hypothetical protein
VVIYEGLKRRNCPSLLPFLLRIASKNCLSLDLERLAPRLSQREYVSGSNLELPLPASFVCVSLIIGLSTCSANFQHEASQGGIEIVNFLVFRWATSAPYKR